MDKKVKNDITRRYKLLGDGKEGTGATFVYLCGQCGRPTRTVTVDSGKVPHGIECPWCHGEAFIQDEDNTSLAITHEWYRPSLVDVLERAERNELFTVLMVLNGGLFRREVL